MQYFERQNDSLIFRLNLKWRNRHGFPLGRRQPAHAGGIV